MGCIRLDILEKSFVPPESVQRFLSIDPLAAHYDFQTPYAYAENNPVTKIDVNGEGTKGGGSKGGAKHKVAKGDTFWGIEKANHIAHGTLQKLNPGVNPKDLQIGQEINMPVKSSAAPADNLKLPLLSGYKAEAMSTYVEVPSISKEQSNFYSEALAGSPIVIKKIITNSSFGDKITKIFLLQSVERV